MIGIINYGSGNIQAIANIYHRLNISFKIMEKPSQLHEASKLILPGVGAFDETMQRLDSSGMREALEKKVMEEKIPIIGVCVGMQIMAKKSEEGVLDGLGWIDGNVKKIKTATLQQKPHLPHLGWDTIQPLRESPLFDHIDLDKGFYFLHSFCFFCSKAEDVLASTDYGEEFASAVNVQNIYGVQFHPEKSHKNGIELLKNFASL